MCIRDRSYACQVAAARLRPGRGRRTGAARRRASVPLGRGCDRRVVQEGLARGQDQGAVSYTHLRAHETSAHL
eukprot:10158460-Alexandrium_andersonii.AAC.1